ncbi:hypothetical protein CMV30_02925 [Nibricoccus aquaticus]|uniref:Uncharacterized protein n=1 Tax=Nibricoccus aquaticus TaxID=2576891 RepID=A0A290Q2W0_9BACT|nr:hypothetical protein CMV30_02925 [Nibricoccus aquaticus]
MLDGIFGIQLSCVSECEGHTIIKAFFFLGVIHQPRKNYGDRCWRPELSNDLFRSVAAAKGGDMLNGRAGICCGRKRLLGLTAAAYAHREQKYGCKDLHFWLTITDQPRRAGDLKLETDPVEALRCSGLLGSVFIVHG